MPHTARPSPIAANTATVARADTAPSRSPAVSGPSGARASAIVRRTLSTRPSRRSGVSATWRRDHDRVRHRQRDPERDARRRQHVDAGPRHERPEPQPAPLLHQQDRADRQGAAEHGRGERPGERADPEQGEQQAGRAGREPLGAALDEQDQHDAGDEEVADAVDRRARAEERLAPEEAQALGELGAERRPVAGARPPGSGRASRAASRSRRRRRPRRRRTAPPARARTARRRASARRRSPWRGGPPARRPRRRAAPAGRPPAARRGSATEKSAVAAPSTKAAATIAPSGASPRTTAAASAAIVTARSTSAAIIEPPAVEAVGRDAGREPEQRRCPEPGEGDEPGLGGRARHREHEQRVGDRGRLRPGARQELAGLEEDEVPVAPQRARGAGVVHREGTVNEDGRPAGRPSSLRRVPPSKDPGCSLPSRGGARGRPAAPGWPARACSCRPAAGSELRELDHLGGHVHVADAALGRGQVLLVGREVVEAVLEAVLDRAEVARASCETFLIAASMVGDRAGGADTSMRRRCVVDAERRAEVRGRA